MVWRRQRSLYYFLFLLAIMMGIYDLGQGVVVNQKTVTASQVIGDLITRYEVVDTDLINGYY